jgi:glycosyltransferase involved in cell wall biosynthesis
LTPRVQVSVVVPTYKRPDLLRKCLEALTKQDFPPEAYEIIIVDDAVSEETRSLVEKFQECRVIGDRGIVREAATCSRIRYAVATETQGPAAARNLGWRMARGEIIAFTDDDCLPETDWLKEGVAAIQNGFDGISGQVIVPISGTPTDYEKNVSRLEISQFVTANCFYRRSALEAAGGFDERFTMAWREDADLQFRMLTLCYKLGFAPAARVVHPVRSAPWGVSIKEQRKAKFNALLFKKYPDLYRKFIQPSPPLRYYGIVLLSVGFLAAFLSQHIWIAMGTILLWAVLVLEFTFLRLEQTKRTPDHILEMLVTSMVIPYLSIFWRLYGAFSYRVWFL